MLEKAELAKAEGLGVLPATKNQGTLAGQRALVSGGSRGLGKAIALALAEAGVHVAILYAGNHEAAQGVCNQIQAQGVWGQAYCCDVADFQETKTVVDQILAAWGGIDILVNNAGVVRDGLIMSMKEEDFDWVLNTNLKGAFNLIKHTSRQFTKRRSGRIINISSVSGLCGNAGQANYAAAKAGLIGLTKTVARELASRNVTCNAIAPGFMDTDMTRGLNLQVREEALKSVPLKRWGQPEEIAALVVFLAGENAGYITGEVIRVDGGLGM